MTSHSNFPAVEAIVLVNRFTGLKLLEIVLLEFLRKDMSDGLWEVLLLLIVFDVGWGEE